MYAVHHVSIFNFETVSASGSRSLCIHMSTQLATDAQFRDAEAEKQNVRTTLHVLYRLHTIHMRYRYRWEVVQHLDMAFAGHKPDHYVFLDSTTMGW